MSGRDRTPPPPLGPWDRKPIGYDLEPRGRGWIAHLLREGSDRGMVIIAQGRTERATRRRAEREVRRERRTYDHEHPDGARPSARVVVMYPPTTGPQGTAGDSGATERRTRTR